ncbi:MAG: glycosyltransferase family 39 protein [Candidatus Hydrogenedentes bacterium]|nr:glycosyltransferase family 39 protein [Candidatus Hydrogenedentota bacterium]
MGEKARLVARGAARVLPWLVLAAGAGIRVAQYLNGRSLWLDEVSVAVNIVRRSPAGLFEPLKNAVAPPLFAVLVKVFVLLFGPVELALRAVPLLASLASLLLLWKLAERLLPRGFAALALAFLAFAYPHVFYAQELKQYSTDVAMALLLVVVLAAPAPSFSWRRSVGWGLLGAIAPWLSFPSVFVLGGAGLMLAVSWIRKPDRKALAGLAVTAALWAAGLAGFYAVVVRRLPRLGNLQGYWNEAFLPWPVGAGELTRLWDALCGSAVYFGFAYSTLYLVLLLATVGTAALWRDRPRPARMMLFTALLAYLASALRRYPLDERLALYLSPFLYLAVGAGAAVLCRGRRAALGAALSVALLAPFLALNGPLWREPIRREEIKPLLSILERRLEPDDYIALYYKARQPFYFYWTRYKLGSPERVIPGPDREKALDLPPDKLAGRRVWVLISHVPEDQEYRVFREMPEGMDRLESYREYGASLHLYRFPEMPAP